MNGQGLDSVPVLPMSTMGRRSSLAARELRALMMLK